MTSADSAPVCRSRAADALAPTVRTDAPVLWITGLSGVGKSTLARALVGRIEREGRRVRLLDGDDVRHMLDAPPLLRRHDREQRRRRAWRLASLAHASALQGQAVVVATISLFGEVHAWNRRHHARYAEILLRAPLPRLRERDPTLYGSTDRPPAPHVWGLDLAPEFPTRAELEWEQDFEEASLEHLIGHALALWRGLDSSRSDAR